MKRTAGFFASLCALLLLALTTNLRAETVLANVRLSPGAEINPPVPPPANASGVVTVTINITRAANGTITAATMNFRGTFSFPTSVSVVGFHIHEGAVNANGSVVFDLGINTGSAIFFNGGKGFIDLNVPNVNLARLPDLLSNPSRWYVNLHTTNNPAGAIRGQITKFVETISATVAMSTTQEVNPPTPLPPNATGVGTFTINPTRNIATGEITSAIVNFTVSPNLPAGSIVTGLHIHEAAAGANGSVVINSGFSNTNSVTLTNGTEMVTSTVPATTTAFDALKRLLANPPGFYMNMHTTVNAAGVIRGQLATIANAPVIQQSNTSFLETGNTDGNIGLWISGIEFGTTVLVNGQLVTSQQNTVTGIMDVVIPASLRANPGTLLVQAKSSTGLLSAPFTIVVAEQSKVNTVAATTVDAARFGNIVAPNAIAAAFGTKFASQGTNATALPLPTKLDGTSVYVNGVAAGLFFAGTTQINYLIPAGMPIGTADVVVVGKDGTISRGQANVALTIPSIFTSKQDGTGAPAAVASADGQNFNIRVGNPDGTANPISVGNFVSLFGTGLRFVSNPNASSVTIGGVTIAPLFLGPQGQLEGLDQINIQIPEPLRGRGDVDMIIKVDNIDSNMVKLRIN